MDINYQAELGQLVLTVVYFIVGAALFAASIFIMEKVTTFSIRKEIEEDQNIALGIVIGSVLIGLAIVLSAAIK